MTSLAVHLTDDGQYVAGVWTSFDNGFYLPLKDGGYLQAQGRRTMAAHVTTDWEAWVDGLTQRHPGTGGWWIKAPAKGSESAPDALHRLVAMQVVAIQGLAAETAAEFIR